MNEETIQPNSIILELASYERPVITEDSREDWVEYGADNNYYEWIIERFHNSPTLNAVIGNISRLAYGRGLGALDGSRKPNEYAAMMALFSSDMLRKVSKELKMLGAGHLQVHYNSNHTKIIRVEHIATNLIRPGKCNQDGEIDTYYYSDNWEDPKKFPPKAYSAFGYSKNPIEIMCIQPFTVGMKYFSTVDYEGCLPYAVLEEEIADYLINEVQNSFSGSKVVNFNNGIPTPEQQKIQANKVMGKLTGAKGQKVIVSFNANADQKTTVDDIPLTDAPQHYEFLAKESQQKILNCNNVVSSFLVGIAPEGGGFSSSADEIEVASKYFYNISIVPIQDLFIEGLDQILAFNGISLDLYFKRLDYLGSREDKLKQSESVAMNSHLQGLLAGFGEKIDSNEWTLIDERDVDYDQEDSFNEQVKQWHDTLSKPQTTLGKLYAFLAGTGNARPNRKSSQDAEKEGFYFMTRYSYEGSGSGERDFCNAMMSASISGKVYRKEDIVNMNSELLNAGHGHNGESYDIFLYKGGVNCHHVWRRKTYVSASANAKINDDQTVTVSNAQAIKFGYVVNNPNEVSTQPRFMKDQGHHPSWAAENRK